MDKALMQQSFDWSALPLDVFLNIASFQSFNYLFLLAISGVCTTWRRHSAWIQRLAVFWPPLDDFRRPEPSFKICGRHRTDLNQCTCFHDSISMVISRLHKVCFLQLNSVDFTEHLLQTEKLSDSDWEKLSGSLLRLSLRAGNISPRVLGFITKCKSLTDLRFEQLEGYVDGGVSDMEAFVSGAAGDQSCSLEKLAFLSVDFRPLDIGPLQRLLALCPNVRKIELNSSPRHGVEEQMKFEVPGNLQDYDLSLGCCTQFLHVIASGARALRITGGKLVVLDSDEWLEELSILPGYVLVARPGKMESFWRLTLMGSYWDTHEITSACEMAPSTKRLCLDNDFNLLKNASDQVECYSLFSEMFRGGHVGELELRYGFVCRMWLDEKQEGVEAMIARMPRIGFLVLDLEVGAKEKLDIPRLVDAVVLLGKCCKMEWISLSFTDDINEDVNFHRDCFDKDVFAAVVHNIIYEGMPKPLAKGCT